MNNQLNGHIITEFMARNSHEMDRATLLKRLWAHYTHAKEIDDVLKRFVNAGILTYLEPTRTYVMPQKHVDELRRLFKKT